MGTKSRLALLTLSLFAIPVGLAFAQDEVNDGSKSSTAPGYHSGAATPAPHRAMAPPGAVVGDKGTAAANPHQPGATGETIVKGDSSSIAGDRKATREQKDGTMSQ